MGRPGFSIEEWGELSIGEDVHFFTGAGWKKATVHTLTDTFALIITTNGSTTIRKPIHDVRNIRAASCPTGIELQEGRLDHDQPNLFN